MILQIACAECKTVLGIYEGERFWIAPHCGKSQILCAKCKEKAEKLLEPASK